MTLPERTGRHQLSQMLKGIKPPENGDRTQVKPGPVAYLYIVNFILFSCATQFEDSYFTLHQENQSLGNSTYKQGGRFHNLRKDEGTFLIPDMDWQLLGLKIINCVDPWGLHIFLNYKETLSPLEFPTLKTAAGSQISHAELFAQRKPASAEVHQNFPWAFSLPSIKAVKETTPVRGI